MLLYPAMNKLLEQVPSRYQLVNVVAARARQIAIEAEVQDIILDDKTVSMAVREIAEGALPEYFSMEGPAPVEVDEVEEAFDEFDDEEEIDVEGLDGEGGLAALAALIGMDGPAEDEEDFDEFDDELEIEE